MTTRYLAFIAAIFSGISMVFNHINYEAFETSLNIVSYIFSCSMIILIPKSWDYWKLDS